MIGLGLFLLIVIALYNTPQAKAARVRKAEKYRQQKEERAEKEKTELARNTRQMENFRKQNLVVYIREKDGRKSNFEAVLIRMLLKSGITVVPLSENNGRAVASGDATSLKDGRLALVGTSWHKSGSWADTEDLVMREYEHTYCDYRLLAADENGKGKIMGAGCDHWSTSSEDILANSIIKDLSSTFPEALENT